MTNFLFILLQYLLPKHLLTQFAGYIADCDKPWLKNTLITLFIKRFNVNMNEALHSDINQFKTFNDFFTRQLAPQARTWNDQSHILASPCDGTFSQLGEINNQTILQAKKQTYSLTKLLANDVSLVEHFTHGIFLNCYLSPKDYHRIHMPIAGTLKKTIYVPGSLFSVNPTTADHVPNLFSRNERLICEFDTEYGTMALIMVGAMIVAGITTAWSSDRVIKHKTTTTQNFTGEDSLSFNKGDEIGQFKLGSTVILLFEKNTLSISPNAKVEHSIQLGQPIGTYR
jgi:phosphatidylserine decarboxylase